MIIKAQTSSNQPKEQVTEGSHEAMLVKITDLGTQQPLPTSKIKTSSRWIDITFEVLDQTIMIKDEPKPMWISTKIYPYISENKETNYHKCLNLLAGRKLNTQEAIEFDFSTILKNIYTIQVGTNEKGYAYISNYAKASPKLVELYADYKLETTPVVFSLDEFNQETFDKLPDFQKKIIEKSEEYQELNKSHDEQMGLTEDLPF